MPIHVELYGDVLQVLLVEEAAEVMEIQILASLAPSVEHAIFIGDHEQLRPKAQLWEMQASLQSLQRHIKMVSLLQQH